MNKFTSLCFSLVVAGCLPVCADAAVATGQTADTPKEKSEAGVVSRRMLDKRVRAVSNGSIAPAKSVIKRSESTATLTSDKLYGNRCMPDPTGWGKVSLK